MSKILDKIMNLPVQCSVFVPNVPGKELSRYFVIQDIIDKTE